MSFDNNYSESDKNQNTTLKEQQERLTTFERSLATEKQQFFEILPFFLPTKSK